MHTTYEKIYIESLRQCQILEAMLYFSREQAISLDKLDYEQYTKATIYWARLKLLISKYDDVKVKLDHIFNKPWFHSEVKNFTQARLKLIQAKLLYALGRYHNDAYVKTQGALNQALETVKEKDIPDLDEDYFFCRAYMVMAKINWKRQDVYLAKLLMAVSWAYYDKCPKVEGHYLPARLLCHYGQIYLQEENTEKALEFFKKSEQEYKKEGYQQHFYRPETLSLLGECEIKNKNYKIAAELIQKGIKFLSKYFKKIMSRSDAHLKHLLAEVFVGLAEKAHSEEERLKCLRQASKYLIEEQTTREELFSNKEHPTSARIHNFLSKIYCLKQKFPLALKEAENGIRKNITAYKGSITQYSIEGIINSAGSPRRILVSLQRKSEAYWNRYLAQKDINDLQLAWNNIDLCQRLINAIRERFYNHESKVNVWTYAREIFELGMEILLERKRLTEAFPTIDRNLNDDIFELFRNSKSFLLLQALHPYSMSSISGKQDKEWQYTPEDLRQLMAQVNNCFTSSFQNKDFDETFILKVLEASIRDIEEEKIKTPHYKQVNLQAVYEALNKEIEPGDIISYFLGDGGLYVMVIQGGGRNLQFERLLTGKDTIRKLRTQIKELAALFNHFDRKHVKNEFSAISIGSGMLTHPNADLLLYSQGLYNLLWSKIELSPDVSRLYIIPDEELFNVPFGFLTKSMPAHEQASSFSEMPYLALDYKISYHISTSLLYENHEGKQFFFQEDPNLMPHSYEDTALSNYKMFSIAGKLYKGSSLEGDHTSHNLRAVRNIAQLLGGLTNDPKKGSGEEIKELLKHCAPKLDFFHFFGHSYNDQNTEPSLQLEEDKDNPNKKVLMTQAEIQHLDLKKSILVLINACRGGDGITGNGEAPVSIFQAFLKAGARNIYYSLFTIDQTAARTFTTEFIKALKEEEKSFIDAMHQTQMKLIKSGTRDSHPTVWASPSFIGNQMQTLKSSKEPQN